MQVWSVCNGTDKWRYINCEKS